MTRKTTLIVCGLIGAALTATLFAKAALNDSLEKKVAKMLVLGFRGTSLNENKTIADDISRKGIGGVILFEYNLLPVEKGGNSIDSLKKLCADLQALSPGKLIVSIDQEGGRVNRLKTKYGFPPMVSQQYLGQLNNEDSTRFYARRIATTLRELGINTNFTPNVDVNSYPESPAVGKIERSFSGDEQTVARHAIYSIEEHHKQGILTALKHFPGHGSAHNDSHLGFTDISDTWQEKELEPFRQIIGSGLCDMVMVSHLYNRNIDDTYPATLSHKTITGLLRQKMGWDGVIVTDDMLMKAITENYGFEEALALAINAGVDLIIISSNPPGSKQPAAEVAINAIVKMVRSGKIPQQRIDESVARIEKMLSKQ